MRTEDATYRLLDTDRIAAARWAAIDLLFPAVERAAEVARRRGGRRKGHQVDWTHTYNSAGALISENPMERPGG